MARVELPSGNWVEIRDPDSIRRGDRNAIIRASEGSDEIAAFNQAIRHLITDSSFGDLTDETLDDLSIPDTNIIERHITDVLQALTPNAQPTDDPKAPTRS